MNEALKEQWKCELKALADKKSKIMENKSKLYWLIRGNMSAESVDRVKVYLGVKFDDLEESRDTHTAYYSTGSYYSDAARVKLAYNNIKQYPGESLSGYKDRIDVTVKAMIAVGFTPPSEQEMAADFLTKVNAGYEIKAMFTESNHRHGGEYPTTLYEAFQCLSELSTEKSINSLSSSVFHVKKPERS